MFEYMHTVLNGLKAWVTGEVNKLLSKIDAVGAAASRAFNAAAKNKKDVAVLSNSLHRVEDVAETAQSTANTAKTAADNAQSTANAAKTAADNAQSTANAAKTAADNAQSTAETAKSTAETAHSTAEAAKTIANTCVREKGWPSNADTDKEVVYYMTNNRSNKDVYMLVGNTGGGALKIHVGEETVPSVTFTPPVYGGVQANFEFSRFAPLYNPPLITGIGGVVMYSSDGNSTKQFKLTVDDTGTLKATEVTT